MNATLLLVFAVVLCCCGTVNSQITGEQTQPLQGKGDLMHSVWMRLAQSLKQGQQDQRVFTGRILPMVQGGGNRMDVLGPLLTQILKQRNQVQDLMGGGMMSAVKLLSAGNPTDTLLNAGIPTDTLLNAGIPTDTLLNAGNPTDTLLNAGIPTDTLLNAGIPTDTLLNAGIPTDTLLNAGIPTDTQLNAGIPTDTQLNAGIPTDTLLNAGILTDTLLNAGIPTDTLLNAGIPTGTLLNAGIPTGTLLNAGIPTDTLLNAGIPTDTLLNAGIPTDTLLPGARGMMGTRRSGTLGMLTQKLLTQVMKGRGVSGGNPTDTVIPRDGWMTGTGGPGLLESLLVKGMQERAPRGLVGSGGQSVLGGPLQNDIGSQAERLSQRVPRLGQQGLRLRSQLTRQRPQVIDQSGRWSAFVPSSSAERVRPQFSRLQQGLSLRPQLPRQRPQVIDQSGRWSAFVPSSSAERPSPQFSGLQQPLGLPRQRPQAIDQSGRWSAFVPDGANKASWNRTLEGVEVEESGWCWNTSDVTAALVRSRDAQLREVNYTRASTLYVFREADTVVAVRPEQGSSGGPCFILPSQTVTYQQTEDTLDARNDTVLAAPSKVLNLNATGGTLAPFELRQQFSQNPSLLFFCGFAGVVPATLADDAMFPTQGETETERVLKIVSMDTELNILVPKRPPFPGRFPANTRDSGRSRGLLMPPIFSMMG